MMELRVLRYFLMAAREENMTKAAQLLHVTQPTLSRQIMQLEEELGCKLFRRSNHNIYLTEEGMLLKKRAQDIITLADRTQKEFEDRQDEMAGEIVFGCAEAKCMQELAGVIAAFQKDHPLVKYEIYTANADDIKERLDRGLIDIGLLSEPVDISKYNFHRLKKKEKWRALVPNDSELARKEVITPADLLDIPIMLVKRDLVKNEVENWFGEYFSQIRVVGTYNLLNNAAVMVENHIGVLLSYPVGAIYENLTFVPLSPPLETGFVLVWRKNQVLSSPVQNFLDRIRGT